MFENEILRDAMTIYGVMFMLGPAFDFSTSFWYRDVSIIFISSPEHFVVMVSYCDQSVFVRRPCVVNFLL